MSDNPFKPATKQDAYLRMAITGPSGGGKTFTALTLATALGKTAVLDTERGSAKKYADLFTFDVLEIDQFSPATYIRALKLAEEHGYAVVVLDSLSHAWFGEGGVLDIVEKEKLKGGNRNEFAAWRIGTEKQNDLVAAILGARLHVIGTMRSKTEYVVGEDKKPRKVGLAPVQRDGFEYEFDVLATMDIEHNMMIEKTRCMALDGKVFAKPGAEVADILRAWLTVDAASVKSAPVTTTPTAHAPEAPTPTEPSAPEAHADPFPLDEPPATASEIDAFLGPKTARATETPAQRWSTAEIRMFIAQAEKYWNENGMPPGARPHTVNRLAQVLGLTIESGKSDALVNAISHDYKGSADDAWIAVHNYKPASPEQPALPGTPAPDRKAGRNAAERSGIAAGQ